MVVGLTAFGQDANEVWVSARTNALGTGFVAGSGTVSDPFYGDFDVVMRSIGPRTTVHLLPGVHYTKGVGYWPTNEVFLKPYQRLVGAGMDTTTVRRDTNFYYGSGETVLVSWNDGVELSDMTVDANADGSEPLYQNGCLSNSSECFAVNFGGGWSSVSECEVSSVKGNYISAFCLEAGVAHAWSTARWSSRW